MGVGADHAILERQKKDAKYEAMTASNLENRKVGQKALWENRTAAHQHYLVGERQKQDEKDEEYRELNARRNRLRDLLESEQRQYESELVAVEETQADRIKKMTERAFELKKKREDERQRVVQEKLYQQWREGVDELRKADSNLFQIEVLAARDDQVHEKYARKDVEEEREVYFNKMWMEGYNAKLKREHMEADLKVKRNAEVTAVMAEQVDVKLKKEEDEEATLLHEGRLQKIKCEEEAEAERQKMIQKIINAKQERKKVDEFAREEQAIKDAEERMELLKDKEYIRSVLEREAAEDQAKAESKTAAKGDALKEQQLLKERIAAQAEDDRIMEEKYMEHSRKQWEKRAVQWKKEDDYRQQLEKEVIEVRDVQMKNMDQIKQDGKRAVVDDRIELDAKVDVWNKKEENKNSAYHDKLNKHQDGLVRQMDFHQVQRMREMQQFKIEKRQGEIQEQKFQQAIKAEKAKLAHISSDIFANRERRVHERADIMEEKEKSRKEALSSRAAPWEK